MSGKKAFCSNNCCQPQLAFTYHAVLIRQGNAGHRKFGFLPVMRLALLLIVPAQDCYRPLLSEWQQFLLRQIRKPASSPARKLH